MAAHFSRRNNKNKSTPGKNEEKSQKGNNNRKQVENPGAEIN